MVRNPNQQVLDSCGFQWLLDSSPPVEAPRRHHRRLAGPPVSPSVSSQPLDISLSLSLSPPVVVAGMGLQGREAVRCATTGHRRRLLLPSLSLLLLLGGARRGGVGEEPEQIPPSCVLVKEKGGFGPLLFVFFVSLSRAQLTKIARPISNIVPHNLCRVDNTTLRRLFDLKYV